MSNTALSLHQAPSKALVTGERSGSVGGLPERALVHSRFAFHSLQCSQSEHWDVIQSLSY